MASKVKWDPEGWDAIVRHVMATEGAPRMQAVASACNEADGLGDDGYMASNEGDNPLQKHDFRATVITASEAAIEANARNNTLINEFYRAGG